MPTERDIRLNQPKEGLIFMTDSLSAQVRQLLLSYLLGTHAAKLQPPWILRGALISLVLTIVAGLFRNYRYPNYVLQIHKISWIRCSRYQQQCRLNCLKADPTAISDSDRPANRLVQNYQRMLRSQDKDLEAVLEDNEKTGERLRKEWTYAQSLSIAFALLAMIFLALACHRQLLISDDALN